jgi:type I restriction enzyme R subunit
MSTIGEAERKAQTRVIALLSDYKTDGPGGLGWRYLGDWHKRSGNANIEEDLLRPWLEQRHAPEVASAAITKLRRAARLEEDKLYEANMAFYEMLRYGVQVSPGQNEAPVTVRFIDWGDAQANDLAIAEEVAISAKDPRAYGKRPDIVLYANGIALGVIELKRSTVGVGEGIRQTLDNQEPRFIRHFFTTVQTCFAGNDSEGLRYAAIQTPQPYWLAWKEEGGITNRLDRDITQMMAPERFLELIHDFTLFDAGQKKIARPNQYFAVKAAQDRVRDREGGIIWQTQGSGKSLIMVMLARWIQEYNPDARVLIVTDRKELDQQIVNQVFGGTGDKVRRARSGADLMDALASPEDRVVCSLVHKFGSGGKTDEVGALINDIRSSKVGKPEGDFFVFIDEAHRTQSGKLALAMREILPDAMFIGFTGTPLLRSDKSTSIEIFGRYIGKPYRFDEAVEDEVVLDLRYEARDIDQRIGSPEKIDDWFETNTANLTPVAKAELRKRWGTLQRVLSSKERLEKIAGDIMLDMEKLPRLRAGQGNAMLVAGSIPEACRLFEIFRQSGSSLRDKCAIVTSYKRAAAELTGEESGMGETERQFVYRVYDNLLGARGEEDYEEEALRQFRKEPGRMKLLIVVSRLLTGFDAPPATYLYIDKQMRDHGLFQAVCRVNRIDGSDKQYGYIIDYKDLFKSIERAVEDYTSEAFDGFESGDVEGLISDRSEKSSEDLVTAREAWLGLLDLVEPPQDDDQIYAYFSSVDGQATDDEEQARRRQTLYRLAGAYARSFGTVAEDPDSAGFSETEMDTYRREVDSAIAIRDAVRLHSGDAVDLKQHEPAMRQLLDLYVRADDSRAISDLGDISLVDLVEAKGAEAGDDLVKATGSGKDNVAEAITNNVRKLIIDETPVNPKFYERMSRLLSDLVRKRREGAIAYADYLEKVAEMVRQLRSGHGDDYPAGISTPGRKALYDNLDGDADRALEVDQAVRTAAEAEWRGKRMKERKVLRAIEDILGAGPEATAILDIVREQDEY